jgi:hypothetical protein
MCQYQRGTFECRGDGFLWDADEEGWSADEQDHACPRCNTNQYLLDAKETAESLSSGASQGIYYTGESIWLHSVQVAEAENLSDAKTALSLIAQVDTLRDAQNEQGFEVVKYLYSAQPPVAGTIST